MSPPDEQFVDVVAFLFPNVTQLDLTGPLQVLSRFPNVRIHVVSATMDPVRTDSGFAIVPTSTLANAPQGDILLVPGGDGAFELLSDQTAMRFLQAQSAQASWITSVCTGSILIAAAGLLNGYRATSHWASLDFLEKFGAIPISQRTVRDRNRLTGAGVTSGIDFALELGALVFGADAAKSVQLALEYDPHPLFDSGHPRRAEDRLVSRALESQGPKRATREAMVRKAVKQQIQE
jgi:cyclohexyl-isocyanide hydratase